ncbi:MAG: hypothetical protein WEE89_06510 [Gemmatimonadota bacterium]
MDVETEREVERSSEGVQRADRNRRLARLSTPTWLVRVFIESSFIMLSILLALAVDEWRENRSHRLLAQQSLMIFEREIRQNLARLDDVVPYHSGLVNVVAQIRADPTRATDIRSIVEGLETNVMLNTAWQTALATGALTHMDVETVSALSLTYSLQQRFSEESRLSIPRIWVAGSLSRDELGRTIEETYAYLTDLLTSEQQLRGVYREALEIIQRVGPAEEDSASTGQD